MYERFAAGNPGDVNGVLETAIIEAADVDGLMLLVQRTAATKGRFSGNLHRAIERVAVSRRPSEDWIGAFEMVGAPVSDLRMALFSYVRKGAPEAEIAAACLNAIDELRDEYGPAAEEPRHPDIETGSAWPALP